MQGGEPCGKRFGSPSVIFSLLVDVFLSSSPVSQVRGQDPGKIDEEELIEGAFLIASDDLGRYGSDEVDEELIEMRQKGLVPWGDGGIPGVLRTRGKRGAPHSVSSRVRAEPREGKCAASTARFTYHVTL